jgi:hypothetical protein
MRDDLLDLINRLLRIHAALGPAVFIRACHRARVAIAQVVLEEATRTKKPTVNHKDIIA